MADKGLKYVGTNPIKGMTLGSQVGHKLYLGGTLIWEDPIIEFTDPAVKAICVANWGNRKVQDEITVSEAAAVTSLGGVFRGNTTIAEFDELRYFTGLKPSTMLWISGSSASAVGQFYGCTNLSKVTLPHISGDSIRIEGAFYNTDLEELDLRPLDGKVNMRRLLHNNSTVTKVYMPSQVNAILYAFRACSKLTTIDASGGSDWETVTSYQHMCTGCSKLTDIVGTISNIGGAYVGTSTTMAVSFADCPLLTRESLIVILNGLADYSTSPSGTRTLTLHATAKARLTDNDKAIAQNKNWQIA